MENQKQEKEQETTITNDNRRVLIIWRMANKL
jgi:hypothetical protein